MLSIPWQIYKNGRKTTTYNAHISHAISNLMPEKSANKRRLIGEDLRGELATALMDEIGDKWNLLQVEEQTPETLKQLRKSFEIKTAYLCDINNGDKLFTATLWKKNFPKNFLILLEFPYKNGMFENIAVFKQKIPYYTNQVFSVIWLKNYILTHPEEDFYLNFDTNYSFGESLRSEFYEEINSQQKQKMIEDVKKNQDNISSIRVGKNLSSEWLILPNKKMILHRYNYFNSLMKWQVKDFNSFDCSYKKCVGAVISANENIISK